MKDRILIASVFVAVFGALMFVQAQRSGLVAASSKGIGFVLPTPTPMPTTPPVTSPITYTYHTLSGNISFRIFSPVKGWVTTPAANTSLTAYSNQFNLGVVIVTNSEGNYTVNLREGLWSITPMVNQPMVSSPSSYSINLTSDTGKVNFTISSPKIGY